MTSRRTKRHKPFLHLVALALPIDLLYTRRRFGGRGPLCGIGVTSRITLTSKPAACNARIAASLPEPGPLTNTSTFFMPWSMTFRATCSAAVWAAKGVLLREPRKPCPPALAQAKAFPPASVIVMIVLLKVDLMWTTPSATARRSRRRFPSLRLDSAIHALYFLPLRPIVRRGPLRVREFVRVRWPRTGKPRRCRRPR